MKKKLNNIKFSPLLLLLIILLICIAPKTITTFNNHKYTVMITDKERDIKSKKYLIHGDDKNGKSLVFKNADVPLRLKFNSSNIYGQLKIGKTYELTVIGFRVPFLSKYENIIKIKEV